MPSRHKFSKMPRPHAPANEQPWAKISSLEAQIRGMHAVHVAFWPAAKRLVSTSSPLLVMANGARGTSGRNGRTRDECRKYEGLSASIALVCLRVSASTSPCHAKIDSSSKLLMISNWSRRQALGPPSPLSNGTFALEKPHKL